MRASLFAFFAGLLLLAPYLHAEDVCRAVQTRSYMDIILDERDNVSEILVYNLSKNYRKTGIGKALVYRADISNLTNPASISICYDVADDGSVWGRPGVAKFKYDPNAEGCLDHWFIFCPQYSGGAGGVPTIADQQACLNGTSLRQSAGSKIDNPIVRCNPPQNALSPIAHTEYFPSHNELYLCNQRPKDYAPLCWPLMLIFALLVGANYAMGKNPFQAFDLSAPRMNRGRQYTMRVQQKSFDAMGYLMALDKAVETAGRIGGATTEVAVAEGETKGTVVKEDSKDGPAKKGDVVNAEGAVVGRMENGKFVAGSRDSAGSFAGKGDAVKANVVSQSNWRGPTSLLTGLIGGALTGGLQSVAGWMSTGARHEGKEITKGDEIIGVVNSKGEIIKDGKVVGAVSSSGAITLNDKTVETKDMKLASVVGKEVSVTRNGETKYLGRLHSDGKIRDSEGKLVGSYDKRSESVTAGSTTYSKEEVSFQGFGVKIAGRVEGGAAAARGKEGTEEKSGQTGRSKLAVTAQSMGAQYTSPSIIGLFNLFSDKPWKLSSQADEDAIKNDTWGFVWGKLKQSIGLDFSKDGWVLSLLKMYSLLTTLSTYTRGMGMAFGSEGMSGGISFVEKFNNEKKLFSFPGSDVSYGTFASYIDPSFTGGAGLPYGMAGLQSIFETAAQAGKAGITLTENAIKGSGAPDADYVSGYSGYGMSFVIGADKSYYVFNEDGQMLSKQEVVKELNRKMEGAGKREKEKIGELLTLMDAEAAKKAGVDANNIGTNFKNAGLSGNFFGKIGSDGRLQAIEEGDYKSGLNAQLRYTETRNQTLGILLKYMDNPQVEMDDVGIRRKHAQAVENGGMSAGALIETVENYNSRNAKQKALLETALEQYREAGLIDRKYDLGSKEDRERLVYDLEDVQKSVGKYQAAQNWNLIYMQASNSNRQADSLRYVIGQLEDDKGMEAIQGELAAYQSYKEAELEARRAYQLSLDLGANGAVSKALQEITLQTQLQNMTDKEKEKALTLDKQIAEKESEVNALLNAGKGGTYEYIFAEVELEKLQKAKGITELLKSAEGFDASMINRIDDRGAAIFQNAYERASVLDSSASMMYEAAQKGLSREKAFAMLSNANAAMGELDMTSSNSYYALGQISKSISYAASQLSGIDDNAWRRMDADKREEIVSRFDRLADETGKYFGELANLSAGTQERLYAAYGKLRNDEARLSEAEGRYYQAVSEYAMRKGETGATYRKAPDEASKEAESEMKQAEKEYNESKKEFDPLLKQAAPALYHSILMEGAKLDLLLSISATRDYEGPNRDNCGPNGNENAMDVMKREIQEAMLNVNNELWKGGDYSKMSDAQKTSLYATSLALGTFIGQVTSLERGLYQTSNFFVDESARGNLGQARFGGDFMGAGDQKFLEGIDIYRRETRMLPRLTDISKSGAEYLYGDIHWEIPEWNPQAMPGAEKPSHPQPQAPEAPAAAMQFREYIQSLNPRRAELDNFVGDASRVMRDYLTSNPNKTVVMTVSVPYEHHNREDYNEKLEKTLIKETEQNLREELKKDGNSKEQIDDIMKRVTIVAAENPEMNFPTLSDRINEDNWRGIKQQFVNTQYADEKDQNSKAYKAAVFSGEGELLSEELSKGLFKKLAGAKTYDEFKIALQEASNSYKDPIYFSNAPQKDVKSVYDVDRTAYIGTSEMFETDKTGNYKIKDEYRKKVGEPKQPGQQ